MRENTPRTYVISAELENYTPGENINRHCELVRTLERDGIPFNTGIGRFNGREEAVCICTGEEHEQAVFAIARFFEQESVLVIYENDRQVALVRLAPRIGEVEDYEVEHEGYEAIPLGKLQATGIRPKGDYTWVDGIYYHTPEVTTDAVEG